MEDLWGVWQDLPETKETELQTKNSLQSVLIESKTETENLEERRKRASKHRDPVSQSVTLSDYIASNLNQYGPQHHLRLSYGHCLTGIERETSRPCRFIYSVDKRPLKILTVSVEQQFLVSKKESSSMSSEQKLKLITVSVRIMGTPQIENLFFVAKDLCLLIHIRKGNVAKSIGQFDDTQKARMPVLCERSNGVVSTHVLTVLTLSGAIRLLSTSHSKHAQGVMNWLIGNVEYITGTAISCRSAGHDESIQGEFPSLLVQ